MQRPRKNAASRSQREHGAQIDGTHDSNTKRRTKKQYAETAGAVDEPLDEPPPKAAASAPQEGDGADGLKARPDAVAPDSASPPEANSFALTRFKKFERRRDGKTVEGLLCKQIRLGEAGKLVSDGSACHMSHGRAFHGELRDLHALNEMVTGFASCEALGVGVIVEGVGQPHPENGRKTVEIVVAEREDPSDKTKCARTQQNFHYRPGERAVALIDFDSKAMPPEVREKLTKAGGFEPALHAVLPELATTHRALRKSTSAGIYNTETGEDYPGGDGQHLYVLVRDGADIPRFLQALHQRCWFAGLGWHMVSKSGALLERSIIDVAVAAPERLVFEGPPAITPPLAQKPRPMQVFDGGPLDTRAVCPSLNAEENAKFAQLIAASKRQLEQQSAAARAQFETERAKNFEQQGATPENATRAAQLWAQRILTGKVPLDFADKNIGRVPVAEVLDTLQRFKGEALADPIEGVDYGRTTAVIMECGDKIFTFAHGGGFYELAYDFEDVRDRVENAPKQQAFETLKRLIVRAELTDAEDAALVGIVWNREKIDKPIIKKALREARAQRERERAQRRQVAENNSPVENPNGLPDQYEDGTPRSTLRNAIAALQTFGLKFHRDLFRHRSFIEGHEVKEYNGPFSDDACVWLRNAILEKFVVDVGMDHVNSAVHIECQKHSRHPICDYLDQLKWDGVPRLDKFLHRYFGAEDARLNTAFGRKTLVAAVRRVRKPGCKFDTTLILEGTVQGKGKSTAIEILAGAENFSDASLFEGDTRERMEAMEGVWLFEIAEMEGFTKKEVTNIKAFLSRCCDKARMAYGRNREDRPRQCIFIVTTNEVQYLKDTTGNRRYWPVRVSSVDLDALRRDRDQLWAEAAHYEAQGEDLTLPEELWAEAAVEQEKRVEEDPWEDKLASVQRRPHDVCVIEGCWRIKTETLLCDVLNIPEERQTPTVARRLGSIMRKLGWDGPQRLHFNFGGAHESKRGYQKKVIMSQTREYSEREYEAWLKEQSGGDASSDK